MTQHSFSFEYGDILSKIGATWYTSYAYYKHCDQCHESFKKVMTWQSRASQYKNNIKLEKYFIMQIAAMSAEKLSTNTLGINGTEVLRMAREVLSVL